MFPPLDVAAVVSVLSLVVGATIVVGMEASVVVGVTVVVGMEAAVDVTVNPGARTHVMLMVAPSATVPGQA